VNIIPLRLMEAFIRLVTLFGGTSFIGGMELSGAYIPSIYAEWMARSGDGIS
jgi:hypothetical protein